MNTMENLTGRRRLSVQHSTGAIEEVDAIALPIGKLDALLEAQGDEAAIVSLYCGKDVEWVNGLTHSSVEDILTAGDELNSDFFVRWLQRKFARLERINGGLRALADKATSPSGLPSAASPAG